MDDDPGIMVRPSAGVALKVIEAAIIAAEAAGETNKAFELTYAKKIITDYGTIVLTKEWWE